MLKYTFWGSRGRTPTNPTIPMLPKCSINIDKSIGGGYGSIAHLLAELGRKTVISRLIIFSTETPELHFSDPRSRMTTPTTIPSFF